MKVSNKSVGGPSGKVDSLKSDKTDATAGKKDIKGGLSTKGPKEGSKVDVSERAQMMAKAKGIASESTVDEAKVARLQKMIDSGTYKVDADAVADRLVEEHMTIPD